MLHIIFSKFGLLRKDCREKMKVLLKNSVFRVVTLSRLVSSLGSYIYNIVFIIYATTLPYANMAVFIANIVTVIPTLFTFWIGVKADRTENKAKKLVLAGFIQAILFTIIALLIKNKAFTVFAFIGFLNIVSDVLSDYTNGLRLPIIQKNVDSAQLYEAYSMSQVISYFSSIAGQSLGIWLLTTSNNNYSFVAIINSLTFLVSSIVLLKNIQKLTYNQLESSVEKISLIKQFKEMYSSMEEVFTKIDSTSSFLKIMASILVLNAIGGAVPSIYNFYFMKQPFFHLNYGHSLIVVQATLIIGAIWGSLTPHDYFSKFSISKLIQTQGIAFALVGLSNVLQLPSIVGVIFLTFAAYIMGKASPKLDALLMENLPSEILAQSNNFIGLLFTLSLPVGVSIFSFLALYNIMFCWGLLTMLSVLSLIFISQR